MIYPTVNVCVGKEEGRRRQEISGGCKGQGKSPLSFPNAITGKPTSLNSAQAEGSATPAWEGPAPPKHLQRKISKKVNFLDKVKLQSEANM